MYTIKLNDKHSNRVNVSLINHYYSFESADGLELKTSYVIAIYLNNFSLAACYTDKHTRDEDLARLDTQFLS